MSQNSRTQRDFEHALRNLRHLYEQMLNGHVKNTADAAKGLLGPAIEQVERLQQMAVHFEAITEGARTSYRELGDLDLRVGDVIDAEDVQLWENHKKAIGEPLRAANQYAMSL